MEEELENATGFTVAIIGGGFTGAMLAVQLLQQSRGLASIVLIERGLEPGRGVAYGTEFYGHLLNVRARNMSAYADEPDHFVRWAQTHYSPSAQPDDYLPRPVYGRYVMSQLQEVATRYAAQLRCVQGEAISVALQGRLAKVILASGQTVVVDKVVLALGNSPPCDVGIPGKTPPRSSRFVNNPWSRSALVHAEEYKSVLLIGSGLTSVDVVVELRARRFQGTIHVLSRRGLLPQRHQVVVPLPPPTLDELPLTVRGLLQMIRLRVRTAEAEGLSWRNVIDSLRPLNQQIWRNLPTTERGRFLRHVRAYWDVHRHRIAGSIADQISDEIKSGRMQMHAGRLTEYFEGMGDVAVTFRDRKSRDTVKLRVNRVINCTGPDSDFRRIENPLIADLFQNGLARPDELLLGLDVSDTGAVIDAEGNCSDSLFALGPLRKGSLWETIAVPELRVQVAEMAALLIALQKSEITESAALAVGY